MGEGGDRRRQSPKIKQLCKTSQKLEESSVYYRALNRSGHCNKHAENGIKRNEEEMKCPLKMGTIWEELGEKRHDGNILYRSFFNKKK